MADITYTVKGVPRKDATDAIVGKGDANTLKVLATTNNEVTARADGDTMFVGRLASSARISALSRIYWDDLGTLAPTIDIGTASVDGNVTSDPDSLNAGLDAASATVTGAPLILDISKHGKKLWEIAGESTDPGGLIDIYISFVDAATNTTGTVSVDVYGYTD